MGQRKIHGSNASSPRLSWCAAEYGERQGFGTTVSASVRQAAERGRYGERERREQDRNVERMVL